jgi:hypothetical protein
MWAVQGLFVDGAAAAVGQAVVYLGAQWIVGCRLYWQGVLAAGAHTFTLRYSGSGGTGCYTLQNDSGRLGGGAMRNTMTISELAAP